jgi:GR25 family glycosyltransferase involved in LPS biosynthesis
MNNVKIDVINLEHRTDRRAQVLGALLHIQDLRIEDVDIFKAHKDDVNGALGCAISHFSVLAEFLKSPQYDYQLIFEDDIEFKKTFNIHELINSLDGRFDCFLFAHNKAITIENLSGGFSRVINAQTTSGYIVTRTFAPRLLEKFAESINNLHKFGNPIQKATTYSLFSIDVLWKELQLRFNFITTIPSLAKQRSSYSDVEMKHVDYGA